MGWWNPPEMSDVTIGDSVLDMARHFLKDVAKEYAEDLNRKPTLQELEYVLNLAFKINVDNEILADFEELEIKQVTLKTAKRPKRHKVTPGDIFAFKMDDGRFGFGRVVSEVSIGAVAEIFDYVSAQPVFDYTRIDTWLIPPTTIDSYALLETRKDGDWRIVGRTPGFAAGEKYKDILFVYGTPPNGLVGVDVFDKERPITVEEAKGLPTYAVRGDTNVKKLIERLAK